MSTATASTFQSALAHFHGGGRYLRPYPVIFPNFVITEGMRYVMENAGGGADWLITMIFSHQQKVLKTQDGQDFQIWTLKRVGDSDSFRIECRTDTNAPLLASQDIEYSDFPLDELKMYFNPGGPKLSNGNYARVLYLTSEH